MIPLATHDSSDGLILEFGHQQNLQRGDLRPDLLFGGQFGFQFLTASPGHGSTCLMEIYWEFMGIYGGLLWIHQRHRDIHEIRMTS